MTTQLQNIGLAMQGFGAGIQGNLPQWQSAQNQQAALQAEQQERQAAMQAAQEKQRLERERAILETAFKDSEVVLNLLDQDNLDGAIHFGLTRLEMLKEMGRDSSETQSITSLLIGARNGDEEMLDLARKELTVYRDIGRAEGVLETPEIGAVAGVKSFTDSDGQFVGTFDLTDDKDRRFRS